MTMVLWSDEFSVDIQEIDEQHRRIVAYINELYDALASKDNHLLIAEILQKLVEYTKIHFAVEEALMRIFDYDGYEEHKRIHDQIVQRVLEYQCKVLLGDHKVGMDLLLFLKGWLFEHIHKEDKQYTEKFHLAGAKKKWLKIW